MENAMLPMRTPTVVQQARAQVGNPDLVLTEATPENTSDCRWIGGDTDRNEWVCTRSDAGDLGLGF